jgi:hypothetical protein
MKENYIMWLGKVEVYLLFHLLLLELSHNMLY